MNHSRILIALICFLAGWALHTSAGIAQNEEKSSASNVRVGTFDSRAVALVFGRSEINMGVVKKLKAEYNKAEEAGDEDLMKELEAKGSGLQEKLHKQVFSTWPITDILKRIEAKIPEIAEAAGVDVIVCKWDVVHQGDGIQFVDVTLPMAKLFNPDERTLDVMKQIQDKDPVPIEEMQKHKH